MTDFIITFDERRNLIDALLELRARDAYIPLAIVQNLRPYIPLIPTPVPTPGAISDPVTDCLK